MAFPTDPIDGQVHVELGVTYQYNAMIDGWYKTESGGNEGEINVTPKWKFVEDSNDLSIQYYLDGTGWITKGTYGGGESPEQTTEENNTPAIYAPEALILYFSDPSTQQDIEGCSVVDDDSLTLVMDVTSVNGSLDFPFSGASFEEISGGLRFTGSIFQLNLELAGMKFTPTNTVGPAPQNGSISITLDDQDVATSNATHTIAIEVVRDGR